MVEVVVTGISLVSALGKSLVDSWQQLLAGKSGIHIYQPFPELEPRPLGLIDKQPAQVRVLTQQLVASVLQDAGLVSPLPNCGVVIGSSRSHQAAWEEMARWMYLEIESGRSEINIFPPHPSYPTLTLNRYASTHPPYSSWLDTLPHMNAIATARQIGATGIVLAPMAACATGIWAIAQATFLIQSGQCQQVLTGATEAAITPLTLTGFQNMGALAKTGAYPFDLHREGLVLGEGGAMLILESAESAKQRQAKVYGKILGFGLTTDAYHPNTPEPAGKSAIAAIKQCLERSHLTPKDIDYIHAHGTATQINDKFESKIIQSLFPQSVPVSSTKGATGHTIGASGALGVAFCLMALQQQILPPCVGLKQPEFDLNFVSKAHQTKVQRVLCFSFGFGGQNAVIALEK
ncbi:beta-ketoacyl-ACP synthase [Fischerella thermalis]|uniref:beta-ketoacyl-ACP synthase n=1 Tax=Fischerella thermalis TaxID=372787 RepID=UPI0019FB0A69|nr:beta-ketoacyl-ACP synthase [Fischerella thermalis]MBF1990766.1 beta-ketoacyl-ACP synthase [Fischerella thermalis M58_A2018_009]MBF2061760.1 beta-ketoacyl-ACP synthase [Fischerella thermalis M66_A2018_004]